MYQSQQIANYFVKKSHSTGVELTPMKLLKLCYIAHGWHLGLYGTELLNEVVYAWKYGPVINSIYHDFKKYQDTQISELYTDPLTCTTPLPPNPINAFLDKIWDIYKGYNGIQLSSLTHQSNTPWDVTWNQEGGKNKPATIIPNDLIKSYYKSKIEIARNSEAVAV